MYHADLRFCWKSNDRGGVSKGYPEVGEYECPALSTISVAPFVIRLSYDTARIVKDQ